MENVLLQWGRILSYLQRSSHRSLLLSSGQRSFCSKRLKTLSVPEDQKDQKDPSAPPKDEGSSSLIRTRDKARASDLASVKLRPEEESKMARRFEKDLPPVEEERHKYWKSKPERSVNKALIRTDLFDSIQEKTKENFMACCELFQEKDRHLRGHVEFIYAALSQMPKFGVHRDLEAYKKIIDIFPKGKMIAMNMFQVEFMHYPKQQQCGIDILEQMENYGVIPDSEVQQQFTLIFGRNSFPMRKAGRMLYWMPKFKNLSPFPLPDPLPEDALQLGILAIRQITSVDLSTTVEVFQASELDECSDPTWIVSGQSLTQRELIQKLPANQPIYVEGAFRVWLKRFCLNYFILRAEPRKLPESEKKHDPDDVSSLLTIFAEDFKEKEMILKPTVHEQEDGTILAVCATGTSSRDSVMSWIQFLEKSNPRLGKDIPILFTLRSPVGPTDDLEIPSFQEAEKYKLLPSQFSTGGGGKLGVDPRLPHLKQVGVWTDSETVFPNWPHHHHPEDSQSAKNLAANLKLVDELEETLAQKGRKKAVLAEKEEEIAKKQIKE